VILQFIQSVFVESYDPTLEDSYKKEIIIDSIPVTLEIIDTAGQEELTRYVVAQCKNLISEWYSHHSLRDAYVKNGDGFLLVYSITAHQSFQEVVDVMDQILRAKDIDADDPIDIANSLSVVVIGNKADLQNERTVPLAALQKLNEKFGGHIPIFETSAKDKLNVEQCFMALAKQVYDKKTGKQAIRKDGNNRSGDNQSCCILM